MGSSLDYIQKSRSRTGNWSQPENFLILNRKEHWTWGTTRVRAELSDDYAMCTRALYQSVFLKIRKMASTWNELVKQWSSWRTIEWERTSGLDEPTINIGIPQRVTEPRPWHDRMFCDGRHASASIKTPHTHTIDESSYVLETSRDTWYECYNIVRSMVFNRRIKD